MDRLPWPAFRKGRKRVLLQAQHKQLQETQWKRVAAHLRLHGRDALFDVRNGSLRLCCQALDVLTSVAVVLFEHRHLETSFDTSGKHSRPNSCALKPVGTRRSRWDPKPAAPLCITTAAQDRIPAGFLFSSLQQLRFKAACEK
jgi:hypothetical protein